MNRPQVLSVVPALLLACLLLACREEPGGGDRGLTAGTTGPQARQTAYDASDRTIGPSTTGATSTVTRSAGGGVMVPGTSRDSDTPRTPPPVSDPLARAVVADLARRLGISEGEIELIERSPVEWPDASLGCPQPGMAYAQVITPGYRLVLRAGAREHRYHTGRATTFVYCPSE